MSYFLEQKNKHMKQNAEEIETPLTSRHGKMEPGFLKDVSAIPAMMGDVAYNVGKSVKKKISEKLK